MFLSMFCGVDYFKAKKCVFYTIMVTSEPKFLGKVVNTFVSFLAMGKVESLLFFHKDGFGIKLSTKVEKPLNKETKPSLSGGVLVV